MRLFIFTLFFIHISTQNTTAYDPSVQEWKCDGPNSTYCKSTFGPNYCCAKYTYYLEDSEPNEYWCEQTDLVSAYSLGKIMVYNLDLRLACDGAMLVGINLFLILLN